jgi:Tfp pilus assembly protein PilV
MAKLMLKKVAGATLVEVLIAIVIIMVIFALAIRIFNNVIASSLSTTRVKIMSQLQLLSAEVQEKGLVPETKLEIDSITYEFSSDTILVDGISVVEISARQQGYAMGTIKCLYRRKYEQQD